MKDIISEKLEHVTISILCPAKVPIELGPVNDSAHLGQEAEEAAAFDLLGQLGLHQVVLAERRVQLGVESRADHGHEVVDALDAARIGEKVHDEIAQVAAVRGRHDLHRGLHVLTLDGQKRVASKRWKKRWG